jgi:class 3 adenylate cyclase
VSNLPTGTVTLLMTDLAAATEMLALGELYPAVVADYRQILRDAARGTDGQQVEASGDSSLFAFRRASGALDAAVTAQRSLHEHAWPGGVSVGAAIAVHTGEPTVVDDGYVGADVFRLFLICKEAGPGQILLSEATHQLMQDELPAGTRLRSLGERQLGRLERPERLYQLEIEGLPQERAVARRGLPAGTVTFLFSDIERSTELMRALGDDWPQAHADHRRLLREAVRRVGGREVDTQGDAFFVVFPRARAALDGAASAQRSLIDYDWPGGKQLRVRMGIHTGEPTIGEEGYLGLDVVRGARICSAAHGGQVLVSETTRALVRGDEPAGIELRDLGEHHLKDLEHAERLYQLVAPGLTSDFDRPRSLDTATAPPVPIPALRVSLREGELAREAVAAARDLDALGPAIERQVDELLRATGLPSAASLTPPPRRRRPTALVVSVLVLLVVAATVLWLLARAL